LIQFPNNQQTTKSKSLLTWPNLKLLQKLMDPLWITQQGFSTTHGLVCGVEHLNC